MRLSELVNQNVGILGFGREGCAVFDALRRAGHTGDVHIFVDEAVDLPASAILHAGDASALANIDILVRSPGFRPTHPFRVEADRLELKQTTSTNLFIAELRAARLPVIGITGSKGKSTTSTLASLALREAGVSTVLVGNIGKPALEELDGILNKKAVTVMELSSYQCADLEDGNGPTVACLLDLFPEHLDWHGDVAAYYAAKVRIAETQRPGDSFFYNARSASALADVKVTSTRIAINTLDGLHYQDGWFLRRTERLFSDAGMKLPGVHNRENAIAAFAITEAFGVTPEHMQRVLAAFTGLPYRLQDEGVHGGIRWINDSLSTAPEAAAAALQAIGADATTLIAGGFDRGYDPAPLIAALQKSGIKTLITIPDTGTRIAAAARASKWPGEIIETASLEEAVTAAQQKTPSGSTCIFSPGAPSYNRYTSFEERGTHFRTLIS